MKVTVCKGCGQLMHGISASGTPICAICIGISPDSGIPIEVEVPDEISCDTCGKRWLVSDILKRWKQIPFYNSRSQMFYDGCKGWE